MKKGDLVCSKDKSVVGVVIDFTPTLHNVTIAVLWNEPPTAQGCKTFVLHNDNVILLPKGTIIRELNDNGKHLECEYERYDNEKGIIYGKGNNLIILGCEEYEFIFKDDEDVTTKNNSQYTCLGIEPWTIMEKNFTREEFIGFCKCCILKYVLRRKGCDIQDAEKIEHYARKLQELLKKEDDVNED